MNSKGQLTRKYRENRVDIIRKSCESLRIDFETRRTLRKSFTFDVKCQWSRCHDDDQRLSSKDRKENSTE